MHHMPRALSRSSHLAAVTALAAFGMLVPAGLAQTPVAGTGAESHPAHIHSGSCDQLGDVVVPLTNATRREGDHVGAASAIPVMTSHTIVDMPLQEMIDGAHAINVHKSADEIDVYIACGDIGGVLYPDVEGGMDLTIGLRELNGSGYAGTAWLGSLGEKTEVAIDLVGPDQVG
jgi:hypothetical protein